MTYRQNRFLYIVTLIDLSHHEQFLYLFPKKEKKGILTLVIRWENLTNNCDRYIYIYIYLARTPEIGQGLGRILSCGARKQEQT